MRRAMHRLQAAGIRTAAQYNALTAEYASTHFIASGLQAVADFGRALELDPGARGQEGAGGGEAM